ncbi:MAG TPA: FAD-dependent oxidoreductase [Syntrophorhabdaceae bacterium]|jgi:2,4-dienoyl-CoA reductase (NADPH2)
MVDGRYKHLFSPFKIGKVELKNRLAKTAAQTYFFDSGEHRISTLAKAFYGALAKGGLGLVIVETPAMEWPLSQEGDRRFRIDDDKYIKDIKQLTDEIHKYDCPTFLQFYHRGPWGGVYHTIAPRVAASAVTLKSEFDVHEAEPPHPLTIAEIEEITERYASGALRAAKAGFDGLEINAGADHLFHTFLSRFWNKRDDEYGPQSMENRTRFLVNIIKEIKKRAGQDFPVQVLMNAIEIGAGEEGFTVEEAIEVAKIFENVGVDCLHVRSHWAGMHQGSYHHDVLFYPDTHIPIAEFPKELDWSRRGPLANMPLTAIMKKAVNIPVMAVGGFDADLGEMVLKEGNADLIGMTRRLFADPEYANKVKEGRLDDIQPCTHCGNCNKSYGEPRHCRINASFGREQYELSPLKKKKKVVVVGGGPAGMQAARVAAARGHEVTLFEKGHYLGGALPLAAMVKGFEVEDLTQFIDYFKGQINKLGVTTKLSTEFKATDIDRIKPDVLVMALGGVPVYPNLPGMNLRKVLKSSDLYGTLRFYLRLFGPKMLRKLTGIWMPVGKNVAIIGGSIQGCQLGEFLTKRGRNVTIVETGDAMGDGLAPERQTRLFYWFRKKGVPMLTGVKLVEINDKGLVIKTKEGEKKTIPADNVIPALPFAPNKDLAKNLKKKVKEVYNIGDGELPGVIPDTTAAGWEVGNKI